MRLERALSIHGLSEKMLLCLGTRSNSDLGARSRKLVNLVVGYSGSVKSQIALDIALWAAYQTRLATQSQVKVQVVYVIDEHSSDTGDANDPSTGLDPDPALGIPQLSDGLASATLPKIPETSRLDALFYQQTLERADLILSEARSLSEEWRGSLETHLRFGSPGAELKSIVETQAADLLVLGCESKDHPMVEALGLNLPCAVIGIPSILVTEANLNPIQT